MTPAGTLPTIVGTDLLWTGKFISSTGTDELLLYDFTYWWLSGPVHPSLQWVKVATKWLDLGAPVLAPTYVGDFTNSGKSEILVFNFPTMDWWLGSSSGTRLDWTLVGNTAGFGHSPSHCPTWSGDFTGSGKAEVLFYYPGDKNWFLGQFSGTTLNWSLAGNTAGFGQVGDGRPFWTGDFTGSGKTELLFYYPGDKNWWLATFIGSQFQWQDIGNGLPLSPE